MAQPLAEKVNDGGLSGLGGSECGGPSAAGPLLPRFKLGDCTSPGC